MSNFLYTHGQPSRGATTACLRADIAASIGVVGPMAGLAVGQVPAIPVPVVTPDVTVDAPIGLPTPSATDPLPVIHSNQAELTIVQQRIFAPLVPEWNGMPELARKKWLQITRVYPRYTPVQQQYL